MPLPQGSTHIIATLREFIDAIDRRVPHVERAGEARIARDAAALRQEAVNRIEELTRTEVGSVPEDGSAFLPKAHPIHNAEKR
jgi:hypothetical protein